MRSAEMGKHAEIMRRGGRENAKIMCWGPGGKVRGGGAPWVWRWWRPSTISRVHFWARGSLRGPGTGWGWKGRGSRTPLRPSPLSLLRTIRRWKGGHRSPPHHLRFWHLPIQAWSWTLICDAIEPPAEGGQRSGPMGWAARVWIQRHVQNVNFPW